MTEWLIHSGLPRAIHQTFHAIAHFVLSSCMKPQGSRASYCPPSLPEGSTGTASQCSDTFTCMDSLIQAVTQ